jgi:hypothetical protein
MNTSNEVRIFLGTSEYHNGIKKSDYYGLIYCTYDLTNGLIYIGQTIRVNDKSYIGSGSEISREIKNKGKKNFACFVLDYADCQNVLDALESKYIREFRSDQPNIGYNIAKGGVVYKKGEISEATKEGLKRAKARGVKLGNPNGFTPEAKAKAIKTKKQNAANNKNTIRAEKHIRQMYSLSKKQGFKLTMKSIVEQLNTMNLKTARGKEFTIQNIRRSLTKIKTEKNVLT